MLPIFKIQQIKEFLKTSILIGGRREGCGGTL